MARTKFLVTGEQDLTIDKQMWEIKRQLRQKGGSPIDPELVKTALQDISEGKFYQGGEAIKKEILKKTQQITDFVVGEVFQHRTKGLIPQYFGDNFKNWLWVLAQRRVSINAFGKNILKDYVLPKNMNDTTIQGNASSTLMTKDQFWAMLYLLIIAPKLGKKILKYTLRKDKVYIFHVKLSSRKFVAVSVHWDGDEWYFDAFDFDDDGLWREGSVFLFPAIV